MQGRETQVDLATSPRRQPQINNTNMGPRPKDPLPMVVQGDFRKVGLHFSECFLNCLILKPQSQNEKISVFLFKLMCEGGKKVKKVRGLCKMFQNLIFLQHEGTMIAYFFSTFLK